MAKTPIHKAQNTPKFIIPIKDSIISYLKLDSEEKTIGYYNAKDSLLASVNLTDNKKILTQILCGILPELKLNSDLINKLFNDNNIFDKLIIASGALPRVFLDVFEKSVRNSKAENYPKINNNIFPLLIKEIRQSKDELQNDESDLSVDFMKLLISEIEAVDLLAFMDLSNFFLSSGSDLTLTGDLDFSF
jgi:hypothetical protein